MKALNDYDVIVVGSRVAGAATAMLLARRGLDVLMVDRRRPGSDTLSTHALMRGGVLQLHRWGVLDQVIAGGAPPIRHTVIHYGDEAELIDIKPRDGIDALYSPRRHVLDSILADEAQAAGVEVRWASSVEGLLRSHSGRVIGIRGRDARGESFEARAPVTVGADGLRSRVAQAAGAEIQKEGSSASSIIYSYWSGEWADESAPGNGYEWFYRPGVSAGIIPTNGDGPNGSEVCFWVGAPTERFMGELRLDLESSFHRLVAEAAPEAMARLKKARRMTRFHGFPGVTGMQRRTWGPGWALVGDASHFKDPLSAHGMTDALRDAEFLAGSIESILGGCVREPEAMNAYQHTRDHLSASLFEATDKVASYDWSLEELRVLLLTMSKAMKRETDALVALDHEPVAAAA